MEQYIVVFVFFLTAMLLMLGSLQFSKYKQRKDSCCSGGNCSDDSSENHNNHECEKSKEIENKFVVDIDKLKL